MTEITTAQLIAKLTELVTKHPEVSDKVVIMADVEQGGFALCDIEYYGAENSSQPFVCLIPG